LSFFFLGVFVGSVFLSFVLTRFVRNLAVSRGWMAAPLCDRNLHEIPLPRLGGVAIYLAFIISLAIALLANRYFLEVLSAPSLRTLITILVPGTLIFLLGIYDDIHPVGPYTKFAVQAIAATMLFVGGFRILNLPVLFGAQHFAWTIGLPITILWVLAITNAFNLIDGLDGLAAGSALFSTLVVFVVAVFSGSLFVSLLTISLAGAILGFLRFNFNPATIFLGDCGSLFIGFMLSALALKGAQKSPTIVAVAIPVVSFGLPILETTLSIFRRLISGKPVFVADREHIHHKLLQLGMSHRKVVIVLYAVSAIFALLSLFLLWPSGPTLGLVLAVLGMGVWFGVQHLGYLEFGELRRVAQRTIDQPQIFINNMAIRRAVEALKVTCNYDDLRLTLEAAFRTNDFDAFELRLHRLPGELPENHGLQLMSSGDPYLRWKKPGSPFSLEKITAWSMTLDLMTGTNRRVGYLTIYRLYTERDLQLDINLLTSAFPIVLADAVDRALSQVVEVAPATSEDAGLMAAQAG
jgi:UDP-GlcNAc:undecaprenyl-phosphate/decaprenyl-phosphate GlcNAc-1-phosphate transferase